MGPGSPAFAGAGNSGATVWDKPPPPAPPAAVLDRNWRFVDRGALTEDERRLIDALVESHGNGVFMPT